MNGKSLYMQVVSTILEIKVKLGSTDGSCTLYYPFDGDLDVIKNEFFKAAGDECGDISIDSVNDRLRIIVPESECIRICKMPVPKTLEYMISAVRDHKDLITVKKEINELFSGAVWTDMDNGEFDAKVTFREDEDPFIYCLHDECGQLIYHRFSQEDYKALGFH